MRGAVFLSILSLLGAQGCATSGPGSGGRADRDLSWPYNNLAVQTQTPPVLTTQSRFLGNWMVVDEPGGRMLVESSDPRFLGLSDLSGRSMRFLDMGPGTVIEDATFVERARSVFLVGSIASTGGGILIRALLEADLDLGLIVDSVTLDPDGVTRGFAVDASRRRAVLYEDRNGTGRVVVLDLYTGAERAVREVGHVPVTLSRRGLALDLERSEVFCAVGGFGARHDFLPVDAAGEDTPSAVLVLNADSLTVEATIPMPRAAGVRRLGLDRDSDRLVVLLEGIPSRIAVFGRSFRDYRGGVELPDEVSDMDVAGGYAVAPGRDGIYLVDLDLMSWGLIRLPLGIPGPITLFPSLASALVVTDTPGGAAGVALVDLRSGVVSALLQ